MKKKGDLWLIGGLVLLVGMAFIFWAVSRGGEGAMLVVLQDGREVCRIDLAKVETPYRMTLLEEPEKLVLEIERGRARVSEAACPDRLCERTGWLEKPMDQAVCLPQRVIVRIEGGQLDGVAQ